MVIRKLKNLEYWVANVRIYKMITNKKGTPVFVRT